MDRILVTGATGFVASHLLRMLIDRHPEATIYGTMRWRSSFDLISDIFRSINWVEMNLEDATSVKNAVSRARPDVVFHLGAQSFVPSSFTAPEQTMAVNAMGTFFLLKAVHETCPKAKVHIAGSSEEYGLVYEHELPIKETNQLRPQSPYGISKVVADLWGGYFWRAFSLPVVVTRAFNHEGPGRPDCFAPSGWCRQAAKIKLGLQEPKISVGNLKAIRDYLDVRDVVLGYYTAVVSGKPGEVYNIASGKGREMKEILDLVIKESGIEASVVEDPSRMRPAEVPRLIGDSIKFSSATGWRPKVPFEQTIKDMISWWEKQEVNRWR